MGSLKPTPGLQVSRLAWVALAWLGAISGAAAQSESAEVDLNQGALPVVITPTRLRQSLADVPASVTVITAETLRKLHITSVVDALRLVPGMDITQITGNDDRINYHGTNVLVPRRMNVLVDGMSVYRPALSRVPWRQLPIVVEDIDRIEVTRGPNSAAHGPNSMMAIVNIISKHPGDVESAFGSVRLGSRGEHETVARVATRWQDSSLRLTAGSEKAEGYDKLPRSQSGHDTLRMQRLNLRSHTRVSSTQGLDLQLSLAQGTAEWAYVDPYQATFPDQRIRDAAFNGTYTHRPSTEHEWQVHFSHADFSLRQSWLSCPPTAMLLPELFNLWRLNPAYADAVLSGRVPAGATAQENALIGSAVQAVRNLGARARQPTCTRPNQDMFEKRTDLEFQDTRVLSEGMRLISGVGARHQQTRGETFLGGLQQNDSLRAFTNLEYQPRRWLSLNAGGYAEQDHLTGSSFSPRLAANVHVTQHQTLRFVTSQGTRTPDIYEQRVNWAYRAVDTSPLVNGSSEVRFYRNAVSPGGLKSERITSREVGYLLNAPRWGLVLDVKVFDDHLSDLISEKLQLSSFHPTNNNTAHLKGLEWQSQWSPAPEWSVWFTHAYLDNQASTVLEQTQYARHSGALAVSHQFSERWSGSAAYYASSGNGLGQSSYGRQDMTLTRRGLGPSPWTATLGLSRLDNLGTSYFQDIGSVLESSYRRRLSVFGQLNVGF